MNTKHARMYRRGKAYWARRDFYIDWIVRPYRMVTMPFLHPRLWWFVRRVEMHWMFGFPLPPIEGRDFIYA